MKHFKSMMIACLLGSLALTNLQAKDDLMQNNPMSQDFQKLQQDVNKVFMNFNAKFPNEAALLPKTNLKDAGDHYEVTADLPGVDEANIKVKVEKNILSIDAKSQKSEEKKGDTYLKKERYVGAFHKVLTLPKDANSDKLKTTYKNGVLTVIIPKK